MINPRWHKVIRDLWVNKTRTILVVLAIAVGVFAFASVFTTGDVLVSNMDAQYKAINASTITLYARSEGNSLARWAKRQPEVADAQMRAQETVKVLAGEKVHNLHLYAYDDYENMTVNRITPKTGSWPPERGEILLERTTAAFLKVTNGDVITIELQNGAQHQLRIGGTVHDINAVPANLFPELSSYTDLQTIGNIGLPAVYTRLEIVAASQYDTKDKLDALAKELKERLQLAGAQVGDGHSIREPGEHWGRDTTKSFTLILSIIGVFSLVLSGFLVVNTVSALMMEQRRQIGIMKAIGGAGGQITSMYLTLVVCYGLLALFISIPVGLSLAYVFSMSVFNFLNLDMISFGLPAPVLALQIAASIIVPAIAASIPILGAMRSSVREALNSYGIKEKEKHGLLDRLFLKIRQLPRPTLLSLRNTIRRKGRLMFTLGALTMAGMLFIGVVNVRASLMGELDNIMRTLFSYEAQITLNNRYSASSLEQRAASVPGVAETATQVYIRAQRIKADGTESNPFGILGVSTTNDFLQPTMVSGRWLMEGDRNALVVTTDLVRDMPDIQVGDLIELKIDGREYTWKLVGIMRMAWDKNAYASFDYASSIGGTSGKADSIFIRTTQKDSTTQERVSKAVERRLKDAGVGVSYSMNKETIASTNASQFDFLVSFLMSMAAMSAIIGALGLAGMMGLSVMERTREIGVMCSIGASNFSIGRVVITEGLLIGTISWLLALPLSVPFSLGFNALIGKTLMGSQMATKFSPVGPITWLVIIVVISIIASILPARRAVRMSIRETLSYE